MSHTRADVEPARLGPMRRHPCPIITLLVFINILIIAIRLITPQSIPRSLPPTTANKHSQLHRQRKGGGGTRKLLRSYSENLHSARGYGIWVRERMVLACLQTNTGSIYRELEAQLLCRMSTLEAFYFLLALAN